MSVELPEKPLLDHVIDFLEMVRRILISAIFAVLAMITPDPTLISDVVLGLPLHCPILLHDVASKQIRKRQKA
jgi:sec-independent protein translocase protein TatC